jgi:bifunctional DNase/RNase
VSPDGTPPLVEMVLRSTKISDTGDRQYITLAEKAGERALTIVIGYGEVTAIQRFWSEDEAPPRPMTHDLLVALLEVAGAKVDRIEVTDLKEGTFFALIHVIRMDGTTAAVDARPSDAIALATALKRPIFVAPAVLEDASLA